MGNAIEDELGNSTFGPAEFTDMEDLLIVCRQAASLQPDGTRQPVKRCEVCKCWFQIIMFGLPSAYDRMPWYISAGLPNYRVKL